MCVCTSLNRPNPPGAKQGRVFMFGVACIPPWNDKDRSSYGSLASRSVPPGGGGVKDKQVRMFMKGVCGISNIDDV